MDNRGYLLHPFSFLAIALLLLGLESGSAWGAPSSVSLSNGLQSFVFENPGTTSVAVDLWVRAGSRCETADHNGIAHFVEHLLFKGTARRSAQDISREVAAVGGYMNAYTHWEYTQFHLSLLPDHLDLALDILADIAQNSLMTDEMIDRERKVVLEEISLANIYPPSYVLNIVSRTLFPGSSLGLPICGSKKTVEALTRKDLLEFYKLKYNPDQALLTIVGNVNPQRAQEAVRKYFSSWPQGAHPLPPAPPPPRQDHFQEVRKRKFLDQAIVVLALRVMGRRDADRPAFEIIDTVLGSGGNSRLYQEIREKKGLSYLVGSIYHPLADAGLWATYAGTAPKNVKTVQEIVSRQIGRIQEEPLDPRELADAKNYLRGRLLIRSENNSYLSDYIGSSFVTGEMELPREFVGRLEAVTAEDVMRVARTYLRKDQWNLITLKPYPGLTLFRGLL